MLQIACQGMSLPANKLILLEKGEKDSPVGAGWRQDTELCGELSILLLL